MMRRRIQPKPPTGTQALLAAEREARKQRLQSRVRLSPGGRPMCQYCGVHEAQHTGHRRKDGSVILRKHEKLYTCAECHNARYDITPYWGPRYKREDVAEAY
jgi:hypothetical protein